MKRLTAIVGKHGDVYLLSEESLNLRDAHTIHPETFKQVENFIEVFKDRFEALMNEKDAKGNPRYWEEDHHSKFVNLLKLWMPEANKHDISNSLSAFGY